MENNQADNSDALDDPREGYDWRDWLSEATDAIHAAYLCDRDSTVAQSSGRRALIESAQRYLYKALEALPMEWRPPKRSDHQLKGAK